MRSRIRHTPADVQAGADRERFARLEGKVDRIEAALERLAAATEALAKGFDMGEPLDEGRVTNTDMERVQNSIRFEVGH